MMKTRLLVVDDEIGVADSICALLSAVGFEARSATAEQACLAASTLGVDAVILDVNMPHPDGIALAAMIRRQHRSMPVIFITGDLNSVRRADLVRELDAATELLAKPPRLPDLIAAIDSVLGRS